MWGIKKAEIVDHTDATLTNGNDNNKLLLQHFYCAISQAPLCGGVFASTIIVIDFLSWLMLYMAVNNKLL